MEPKARRLAIREHLNSARAALDSGDRAGALTAVRAALALDPDYLAAQALKEQIDRSALPPAFRRRAESRTPTTLSDPSVERTDEEPEAAAPAVDQPPAVSAEGWARFEQRARSRRIERRVAAARADIVRHNFGQARAVLDEIREIDPDHPDLISLGIELDAEQHLAGVRHRRWGPAMAAVIVFAAVVTGVRYFDVSLSFLHDPLAVEPSTLPVPTPEAAVLPESSAPLDAVKAPAPAAESIDALPSVDLRSSTDAGDPAVPSPEKKAEVAALPPPSPLTRDTTRIQWPPESRTDGPAVTTPPSQATGGTVEAPAPSQPAPPLPPAPSLNPAVTPANLPGSIAPDSGDSLKANAAAREPEVARARTVAPTPSPVVAAPRDAGGSRDEELVRRTLQQYRLAYENLDARSAQAVWPRVDSAALQRAFAGLQEQRLTFDDCQVQVRGATSVATCRGMASYVPKVGSRDPHREPRVWTFDLRKVGDDWQIDNARVER